MKITDLRVVLHERRSPASVGQPVQTLGVVSIVTDAGLQGHAFISGPSAGTAQELPPGRAAGGGARPRWHVQSSGASDVIQEGVDVLG